MGSRRLFVDVGSTLLPVEDDVRVSLGSETLQFIDEIAIGLLNEVLLTREQLASGNGIDRHPAGVP
ncbi:hypothetical protein GF395_02205 [Candidatus Uhrbacteria bacterium]|nr:hypothetical protein [Candidatus Uhrbacteria bacterium]